MSFRRLGSRAAHVGLVTTGSVTASPVSDADMLRRMQHGDAAAFEGIFRQTVPGLVAFVAHAVQSRAVAEEIVQEVLFRFWERRASIEIRGSLTGYLYAAARHAAIDYARSVQTEHRMRAAGGAGPIGHDMAVPPMGDIEVREAEIAAALQAAIARLPERRRTMFLLHRSRGLTYPQIAARLCVSVKTVETQIGRALGAVRDALRPYL